MFLFYIYIFIHTYIYIDFKLYISTYPYGSQCFLTVLGQLNYIPNTLKVAVWIHRISRVSISKHIKTPFCR